MFALRRRSYGSFSVTTYVGSLNCPQQVSVVFTAARVHQEEKSPEAILRQSRGGPGHGSHAQKPRSPRQGVLPSFGLLGSPESRRVLLPC